MLPDLQSSLLCDDVRQERNGKFILIGLYQDIPVPAVPAVMGRLCIVNRWCCGTGTFKQRSRVMRPEGTVLVEGKNIEIKLGGEEETATSVEYFMNVNLEEEGTYWVEILLENDMKLRYPLKVIVVKNAQGQ
ncbi:hypothetical protein BVX97_06160 [bacterium E08(2017)]|nr:hypothetical protein BVX97_06160 [bacterium E08(2017)]